MQSLPQARLSFAGHTADNRISACRNFQESVILHGKSVKDLAPAIPAAEGRPDVLAQFPNALEYVNNQAALKVMNSETAKLRVKQQTEITTASSLLFAHVLTRLDPDSLALVKQHADFADSDTSNSTRRLFAIIEEIFSTPEGGSTLAVHRKAAALRLLTQSTMNTGESLSTYGERLANSLDRCRDLHVAGKGIDDDLLVVYFLQGLTHPCYNDQLAAIKSQTAIDPRSFPKNIQAAIEVVSRLGGPPTPPNDAGVPALAAVPAPARQLPPSASGPQPRNPRQVCPECGAVGSHFGQYCSKATATQRAKHKAEHERNVAAGDKARRDRVKDKDKDKEGDKKAPKAPGSHLSENEKAMMAIASLVLGSGAGSVPGYVALTSNIHASPPAHAAAAPPSAVFQWHGLPTLVAVSVGALSLIACIMEAVHAPGTAAILVVMLAAAALRQWTADRGQPMPEPLCLDLIARRARKTTPVSSFAAVPTYKRQQLTFHDTGAAMHFRGEMTSGECANELKTPLTIQGSTGSQVATQTLQGPDSNGEKAVYVPGCPNLESAGLSTSSGGYESVDFQGRFRTLTEYSGDSDGTTTSQVFLRVNNTYPLAAVFTVKDGAIVERDVLRPEVYRTASKAVLALVDADVLTSFGKARQIHLAVAHSTVLNRASNSFNSVEANEKRLPASELQRAKIAMMMLESCRVSKDRLCEMLTSGAIEGTSITTRDVENAIKTYGQITPKVIVGSRSKPPHTEKDMASKLTDEKTTPQTGFMDAFKLGKIWLWISSWWPSRIVLMNRLRSHNAEDVFSNTQQHIDSIKSRGYPVPEIQIDGETGFHDKRNISKLAQQHIRVLKTAPAGHNVQVEGAVGPTRESLNQALFSFHQIAGGVPSICLDPIVQGVQNMRLFALPPDKESGISPGQKFFRRNLMTREAILPPGSLVYCKVPATSAKTKSDPRGQPAIYLAPNIDANMTAIVLLLEERKTAVREMNEMTFAPMHASIKSVIKQMCEADKLNGTELEYPKASVDVRTWSMSDDDSTSLSDQLPKTPLDELNRVTQVMQNVARARDAAVGAKGKNFKQARQEVKIVAESLRRVVNEIRAAPQPAAGGDRGASAVPIKRIIAIAAMTGPLHSPGEDRGASSALREELRELLAEIEAAPDLRVLPPAERLMQTIRILAAARKQARHVVQAYNITVADALATYPNEAEESIRAELDNILLRTFKPMDWKKIKGAQILTSKMFCKLKWDADGTFDKIKSRLVGGGHRQNKDDYDDVSAPAIGTTALFTLLAIAAFLGQQSKSVDIPAAYLNAPLDKAEKEVYMSLDKKTSEIAVKMRPELAQFLDEHGRINGQIDYALYGLVQSAMLWYKHITATLISLGYVQNDVDACVFNKDVDGTRVTVALYVDDLKIFSADISLVDSLIDSLSDVYGKVTPLTIKEGEYQSYLGMLIDSSVPGQFTVTMPKYVADILSSTNTVGTKPNPASVDLLSVDEHSPRLDAKAAGRFRSVVMTLFYMAKRTRPDMLTAVAFLSRRTTVATKQDEDKLQHLLMYLNGTPGIGILIKPGSSLQVYAYVDAAYGTHYDMKSHTGCLIRVGEEGSPVFCKSAKQSIVSRSSTEAELIALSDSGSQVIWVREFMIQQGFDLAPATIYQDNMSTISLISNGRPKAEKSRHINIRYFWLRDRIVAKDIQIEHMPTDMMIADMLTKPLTGELFRKFRDLVTTTGK